MQPVLPIAEITRSRSTPPINRDPLLSWPQKKRGRRSSQETLNPVHCRFERTSDAAEVQKYHGLPLAGWIATPRRPSRFLTGKQLGSSPVVSSRGRRRNNQPSGTRIARRWLSTSRYATGLWNQPRKCGALIPPCQRHPPSGVPGGGDHMGTVPGGGASLPVRRPRQADPVESG